MMETKSNKEKFLSLVNGDAPETRQGLLERNKDRELRAASRKITLVVRKRLEEMGWTQKRLAEKMDVSPQAVNKWLKGGENFTLGTLLDLERALGTTLIQIKDYGQAPIITQAKQLEVEQPYELTGAKIIAMPIKANIINTADFTTPYIYSEPAAV